jgi:HEAT repeat protein/tRNA A-37 threonylcarbamoyl transferase component Bud32
MRVCTACKKVLGANAHRCPEDGAAAAAVETLPAGARLGSYQINRVLGEGGMGFVYEATHEVLNRRTAIKMLRSEMAAHPQVVTRFLNEAKAVNLIDHPNIVNVYDYGDDQDGGVYFVMEYLEGETLDDLMRRRRPMALPLMLHLFGQTARALAAAHAKQIVHRDLKPANVFIIAREQTPYFVKLLDFGIAQLRGAGAVQGLTAVGQVMGTPQYMSPEQISGGTVDARSDVWAMGVMLYRAATGQAPYKGETFAELTGKILHHPPRPAGEITPLPAALAELIASCLERQVSDRCPSVESFIAGLDRVKREQGLDDDAIRAAVVAEADADVDAPGASAQPAARDATRQSIAGSVPRYQGVSPRTPEPEPTTTPPTAPARRSRLPLYVALGAAAAAGLGAGAYTVLRPRAGAAQPPVSASPIGDGAGDMRGARALAERHLGEAIATGTLQQQGFAVDAIGLTRVAQGAPLLYRALEGAPEVRAKAARALGELRLPDAAPKLRAALADSGERLKVDLSAEMYRLGDKSARAILMRALDDPGEQLTAAAAMADVGDDAGRATLGQVLAAIPAGLDQWRRAAGGLVKLGDARARALLEGELAQPDAARSVGAAEVLARAGDDKARALLLRVASDVDFARRGDAAVALARLGDRRALGWAGEHLKSPDGGERTLALAICGLLAGDATAHAATIARLSAADPDPGVRMTAGAVLLGL